MGQVIKISEMKNVAKQDIDKIFVIIPEFGNRIEKKVKEKKIKKESRLFKKQKKNSIDNVKSKVDTKIYYNRFVMR